MILIKKIRIRYYRCLKEINLNNINEFNVFSGKNDSGKSNMLKALDIFFNEKTINFDEDYNKERLAVVRNSIKGKQLIDIRITFKSPESYKTLPKYFTVTKTWDRSGKLISTSDDLESLLKNKNSKIRNLNSARRSLSSFLKKIRYMYVPGVRDEIFFSGLLQELQIALFEKEDRRKKTEDSVKDTIKEFNNYIGKITSNLNEDFKKSSGIETNLSFPSELTLLFKRLLVDTKEETHDIPLYLRGDGIRLRYIPVILNHIAIISPKYFIWGFDEPENSCEYSLSSKLADDFLKEYTKSSQIFVSTHSFSFTSIEDKKCTIFRVYNLKVKQNSIV